MLIRSLVSGIALIFILYVDKYWYDRMIFGNGSLGICPFLYCRWNVIAVCGFPFCAHNHFTLSTNDVCIISKLLTGDIFNFSCYDMLYAAHGLTVQILTSYVSLLVLDSTVCYE